MTKDIGGDAQEDNMRTKPLLALASLGLVVCVQAHAQADSLVEACKAVYQGNLADIRSAQSTASREAYAYSQLCHDHQSKSGSASAANVSGSYGLFSASGGQSKTVTQEDVDHFCETHNDSEASNASAQEYARQVAVPALKEFNECVGLANHNVGIDATFSPPNLLTIHVDPHHKSTIHGVASSAGVICKYKGDVVSTGKDLVIDDSTYIECQRDPEAATADHYAFGDGSVVVEVDDYPFHVVWPAVDNNSAVSEKALLEQVALLQKELDASSSSLAKNLATVLSKLANRSICYLTWIPTSVPKGQRDPLAQGAFFENPPMLIASATYRIWWDDQRSSWMMAGFRPMPTLFSNRPAEVQPWSVSGDMPTADATSAKIGIPGYPSAINADGSITSDDGQESYGFVDCSGRSSFPVGTTDYTRPAFMPDPGVK